MSALVTGTNQSATMFFSDARGCKAWFKSIPLTNVSQAQQMLRDALRHMNGSESFVPLDRLTCLELLRDNVSYLVTQQRARLAGKSIPLATGEYAILTQAREMVAEMEAGYRRCWSDADGEDSPLAVHATLILQRSVRYIGLQMMLATIVYRPFDSALWTRLHGLWLEAERRGLADKRVKDSVGSLDGVSSVQQAYAGVLLWQLANCYALSARQIDFIEAVLQRFIHKVNVMVATTSPGPHCVIDLTADTGAEFHANVGPDETVRVLDLLELSRSLRRRIKKLMEGEEPGKLDLPADWSAADACTQLTRLHLLWCEGAPPATATTVPDAADATLAFGLAQTHFYLHGNPFEQPGAKRELTRQELNDIKLFGKVSQTTIAGRTNEFNFATENWKIVDETRNQLRLLRPTQSARGVAVGRLLGIKIGAQGGWHLVVVRELLEEPDGYVIASVEMLPGVPQPAAVRSADLKNRTSSKYVQAFRIAANEAQRQPEMLLMPPNLAKKGGPIDLCLSADGVNRMVTLADFAERCADFDRVFISG
ncbi:MAG: hypothetical protein HY255_12035 [Betaproteobacteria bacterium]|nr:hypothetical protein [Betaproteobacteria bacterium]